MPKKNTFNVSNSFSSCSISFFSTKSCPGDIVALKLTAEGGEVTEEQIEAEKTRLGLNDPIHIQFYDYITGLPQGDLGISLWTEEPVSEEIGAELVYLLN